jgi:dynein heavy chain
MRLLLIRSMRDDRTTLAADAFIAETLSDEFIKPITTTMEEVWEVSATSKPIILMLTPGFD